MTMAFFERQMTLEKARADQGTFENEVSFEHDDLLKSFESCPKIAGHGNLVPIRDFGKIHLPLPYQDELMVQAVNSLADLTARITVHRVSPNRPDRFSTRDLKYPYSHCGGQSIRRHGSGWIVRVKRKVTESDGKTCKCIKCSKLPEDQRSRVYGEVMIWTAKHLVFDQQEVEACEIILVHDTGIPPDYSTGTVSEEGFTLYPKSMWYSEIEGDWCGVRCVTHDLDMWERLRDMYKLNEQLQKQIDARYKHRDEHVAIIVSHPHGLNKRVSVGEWLYRDDIDYNDDNVQTYYTYDTHTCQGCSGAPVWIIGRRRRGLFTSHPHSCCEKGKNRSAVGFDW